MLTLKSICLKKLVIRSNNSMNNCIYILSFMFLLMGAVFQASAEVPSELAESYFQRVTGYRPSQRELNELDQGDEDSFFESLFALPVFYNNRLASFVSKMSDTDENPFENEDDFQATVLLAISSNIDFRKVFTNQFSIEGPGINTNSLTVIVPDPLYYKLGLRYDSLHEMVSTHQLRFYDKNEIDRSQFVNDFDQDSNIYQIGYYDGIFTTYGFGQRFMNAGTNRRAIEAIYEILLCSPIESYKDSTLDAFYIAPDIDKAPSGDPYHFENDCSACHASLDAQRGGLAKIQYVESNNVGGRVGVMAYLTPLSKYNRNPKKWGGFITASDEWENPLTTPIHQERFGWRGPTHGRGVLSFASMIVNSEIFQTCMTEKIAAEFCDRPRESMKNSSDMETVRQIGGRFRDGHYKLKSLIKDVIRSPLCQ